MSMIRDPYVTDCGHTFCYQCISMHLLHKKSCPSCSTYVTADKIHPNFLLAKVRTPCSKLPSKAKYKTSEQYLFAPGTQQGAWG